MTIILNQNFPHSISEEDEDGNESSYLDVSFMSAAELRRIIRLKDVEIKKLRDTVEDCERRNINERQEILKESKECTEKVRQSDKKFFEEKEERLKDYYEKKVR